jgi:hypothetical protein
VTEQANSPKARMYERMAEDSRKRAEEVEDGAVKDYILNNARHYDRRAQEVQRKANQRKARRNQ